MDLARIAAGGRAVNRIAFGTRCVARPQAARSSWIGPAARKLGAQVMIRSQGIRDVALGAGALIALGAAGLRGKG